jgi:hypothetical protein
MNKTPEITNQVTSLKPAKEQPSTPPKPLPRPNSENLKKSNFNRNNKPKLNQNTRPANVAFTRRNSPSQ